MRYPKASKQQIISKDGVKCWNVRVEMNKEETFNFKCFDKKSAENLINFFTTKKYNPLVDEQPNE